jgi:predicted TIM-barrel fold metal-dependent hydrolase
MERCEGWTAALVNSNKWLLPHAERGIVELAAKLLRVAEEFPALRIYVPHLAWPTGGADWLESIRQLSSVPRLMIGVSALSHFSKESFPHEDLRRLIDPLLQLFGPERLVAATGYPQSGKGRYADYIKLSGQWIRSVWPEWSDPDALLT